MSKLLEQLKKRQRYLSRDAATEQDLQGESQESYEEPFAEPSKARVQGVKAAEEKKPDEEKKSEEEKKPEDNLRETQRETKRTRKMSSSRSSTSSSQRISN